MSTPGRAISEVAFVIVVGRNAIDAPTPPKQDYPSIEAPSSARWESAWMQFAVFVQLRHRRGRAIVRHRHCDCHLPDEIEPVRGNPVFTVIKMAPPGGQVPVRSLFAYMCTQGKRSVSRSVLPEVLLSNVMSLTTDVGDHQLRGAVRDLAEPSHSFHQRWRATASTTTPSGPTLIHLPRGDASLCGV